MVQVSYIVRMNKARSTWAICEDIDDARCAKIEAEQVNQGVTYMIIKREISETEVK